MCGRFTQARSWAELVDIYRITETDRPLNIPARYNVAPTQDVPVIRHPKDRPGRELVMMRWGLVPFWAKDIAIGAKMINARADSVAEKPAFRAAFKTRRCLIAADGFYEWRAEDGGKQPYYVTPAGGEPFAFAGLWERWTPQKEPDAAPLQTCTIITTDANAQIASIHDRMPVMLGEPACDIWLDPERPKDQLQAVLKPYSGEVSLLAVSPRVNSVKNDDPACLVPMNAK